MIWNLILRTHNEKVKPLAQLVLLECEKFKVDGNLNGLFDRSETNLNIVRRIIGIRKMRNPRHMASIRVDTMASSCGHAMACDPHA